MFHNLQNNLRKKELEINKKRRDRLFKDLCLKKAKEYLERNNREYDLNKRQYYNYKARFFLRKYYDNDNEKVNRFINQYYENINKPIEDLTFEQALLNIAQDNPEFDPLMYHSGIKKIIIKPQGGNHIVFPFDIYKYKGKNRELRGHWVVFWDKNDNTVGVDLVPENVRTYVSTGGYGSGKEKTKNGNTVIKNEKPDFRKRTRFYLYDLGKFTTHPYNFDLQVVGIQDGKGFSKRFTYKAENDKGQSRSMGINIGYTNEQYRNEMALLKAPTQYITFYDIEEQERRQNEFEEMLKDKKERNEIIYNDNHIYLTNYDLDRYNADFNAFSKHMKDNRYKYNEKKNVTNWY